jgi:predicted nucleic acid-binding protein
VTSEVVAFEIARARDAVRRELLRTLVRHAARSLPLSEAVGQRARRLRAQGLRDLDALHLAAAEAAGAETLVTTDDGFERAAGGLNPPSAVHVRNPVPFALEVLR